MIAVSGRISARLVHSKEEVEMCQRLRHMAYCEDREWEPKTPERLERDQFDQCAEHVLVALDSRPIATARLIYGQDLPFWKIANELPPVDPARTGEISRFAFPRETHSLIDNDRDRKTIIVRMMGGLMKAIEKHNVQHIVAVHAKSANLCFRMVGAHFRPVGEMVNYHGLRQPYWAHIEEYLATWQQKKPENYELLVKTWKS